MMYCAHFENFIARHEQFCLLLDQMIEVVRDVSEGGLHYPPSTSDVPIGKKLVEALGSLKASEVWTAVKIFLLFWKEAELPKRMQMINQVDGRKLDNAVQVLGAWNKFYEYVLPRLENENRKSDIDVVVQSQQRVTALLKGVSSTLNELLEACGDQS